MSFISRFHVIATRQIWRQKCVSISPRDVEMLQKKTWVKSPKSFAWELFCLLKVVSSLFFPDPGKFEENASGCPCSPHSLLRVEWAKERGKWSLYFCLVLWVHWPTWLPGRCCVTVSVSQKAVEMIGSEMLALRKLTNPYPTFGSAQKLCEWHLAFPGVIFRLKRGVGNISGLHLNVLFLTSFLN